MEKEKRAATAAYISAEEAAAWRFCRGVSELGFEEHFPRDSDAICVQRLGRIGQHGVLNTRVLPDAQDHSEIQCGSSYGVRRTPALHVSRLGRILIVLRLQSAEDVVLLERQSKDNARGE